MFKNSNQRPISNLAAKVELEKFPPYLVEVDTGEEILMLPEDDRYRGVPASAYDLENQLKEGFGTYSQDVLRHQHRTHLPTGCMWDTV